MATRNLDFVVLFQIKIMAEANTNPGSSVVGHSGTNEEHDKSFDGFEEEDEKEGSSIIVCSSVTPLGKCNFSLPRVPGKL